MEPVQGLQHFLFHHEDVTPFRHVHPTLLSYDIAVGFLASVAIQCVQARTRRNVSYQSYRENCYTFHSSSLVYPMGRAHRDIDTGKYAPSEAYEPPRRCS
ncbi:MAG TPA: hypothetical protein VL485_18855 [Ktedonobacteraceae bacterium]|jgi:hypothetical protein|nr:hypothetical protein [Ktedonobacteraceae bacterium]